MNKLQTEMPTAAYQQVDYTAVQMTQNTHRGEAKSDSN